MLPASSQKDNRIIDKIIKILKFIDLSERILKNWESCEYDVGIMN